VNPATDLATLRVIVAAAEQGSISAAGDQLGLAVAAASARITALEEALGLRVFERSSRGVRLTPAGHMLVQRARALLSDVDRLAMDLHGYSQGLQGHVRLVANTSAVLELLPQRLQRMASRYPLIQVDLEEHGSLDIPLLLLAGRADIGIVDMAHPLQDIEFRDLFTDTLVLVVPLGHRLAQRRELAFEEALEEVFIALGNGTALSNRMVASAAQAGKPIHIRMQMRGFDAVCRMIAAGLGVGVLPREAIAPQLATLPIKPVPLSDPWALRTHRLALRTGVPVSPAARTLIAELTG
jgi:DNA-binding transcriptional LysR family regulator